MKKMIFALLIAVCASGMMSVGVFAHGNGNGNGHGTGHGHRTTRQVQDYAICSLQDCTQDGLHQHDGVNYYCASHGTGTCRR